MKAISLWQPWATGMRLGLKRCETRHWPTSYRGPLAIHAAKRVEVGELFMLPPNQRDVPRGAVLGVVELVDCLMMGGPRGALLGTSIDIDAQEQLELDWGNWQVGRWAWVTRPLAWFAEPVPAVGRQGLWDWQTPCDWREIPRLGVVP